jgi:uncharacterized Zn finger protein
VFAQKTSLEVEENAMLPKNIKQAQSRSRKLNARVVGRQTVIVDSQTEAPGRHAVTVRYRPDSQVIEASCTCSWSAHQGVACAHVMAALATLAERKGRALSYWLTEEEARRQRHRRFFLTRTGERGEGVWVTSRPAKRAA